MGYFTAGLLTDLERLEGGEPLWVCWEGVGEDGVLLGGGISVMLFDISGWDFPLPVHSKLDSDLIVEYGSKEETDMPEEMEVVVRC